jgi:phosphopantothenoylcysteine decarboxylase
MSEEPPRRLNL